MAATAGHIRKPHSRDARPRRLHARPHQRPRRRCGAHESFFFNDTATTEIYTLSLHDALPFFRTVVDNLEMTLAKSSLEVARGYLELVADAELRDAMFAPLEREHELAVSAVLRASGVERLLDRQPVVQQTIDLRNPYVDPMNAIQVELLRRHRAGDASARLPLLRSIA